MDDLDETSSWTLLNVYENSDDDAVLVELTEERDFPTQVPVASTKVEDITASPPKTKATTIPVFNLHQKFRVMASVVLITACSIALGTLLARGSNVAPAQEHAPKRHPQTALVPSQGTTQANRKQVVNLPDFTDITPFMSMNHDALPPRPSIVPLRDEPVSTSYRQPYISPSDMVAVTPIKFPWLSDPVPVRVEPPSRALSVWIWEGIPSRETATTGDEFYTKWSNTSDCSDGFKALGRFLPRALMKYGGSAHLFNNSGRLAA